MWVVLYTCTRGLGTEDFYNIFDNLPEATTFYEGILECEDLYCAGIAAIHTATEPHWVQPQGA